MARTASRPRLDDEAEKAKPPSPAERKEIEQLVEERYQLHQKLHGSTFKSILEEAKLAQATHEALRYRYGATRLFLGKIGQNAMWFTRMRAIADYKPFADLSADEQQQLPAKQTHLHELTKVVATDFPRALKFIKPDMPKREMTKALKLFIPKRKTPPKLSEEEKLKAEQDKLEEAINRLKAMVHENKLLAPGAIDLCEDMVEQFRKLT